MKKSVPAPALSADVVARLERARDFIESRFAKNPTLPKIAEQAGMNPFHFHRLFTKHFGQTPKKWLDELRIAAAKEMLNWGESIPTITQTLGFAHQSHFTCRFRQLVGEPPGRWIRQQKVARDASGPA